MSYLKLLSARRNSGQLPSMKPICLSGRQKHRADQQRCIECGTQNTCRNSYLCEACQSKDTLADIQSEIKALRQKLLNRRGR